MPDERETILEFVKTQLGSTPGTKFASRDYSLVLTGQITEFPSLFILDMGDNQVQEESTQKANRRTMRIGIGGSIKGTTSAQAPIELAAFLRAAKKQLYNSMGLPAIKPYVSWFTEVGLSPLVYLDTSSNTVYQEIQLEIMYIENITNLKTE